MIASLSLGIQQNLRFLITEVSSQLSSLQHYFNSHTASDAKQILDRSGYVHNLKSRVLDGCLELVAQHHRSSQFDPTLVRAIESIAHHLDLIAKLCRDTIYLLDRVENSNSIQKKQFIKLLDAILQGVEQIEVAIAESDTGIALGIGNRKQLVDQRYERLFNDYSQQLRQQKQPHDLVHALLVAHTVQQMGEAILTISEALITAHLGLPLNASRYRTLQSTIDRFHDKPLEALSIKPIAETRSGSGISGISENGDDNEGYVAIYKDGTKRKLKEERQGLESWHEIVPGIAPRIIAWQKQGRSASMLIEHLPGFTLEQILLDEQSGNLELALKHLTKTLKKVWSETRSKQPSSANHMQQLSQRLPAVYSIHPHFQQQACQIGGHHLPEFDRLVREAGEVEARLKAPFSVYIHGDFNLDNIIFDPAEQRINFIDLHRSHHTDYSQDISVLMVSCYRLQIFDRPLRLRSMALAIRFYQFARRYAEKNGDQTFELRLAFGLARSFATSTRFILDPTLANNMFFRARYLLERIMAQARKDSVHFDLPVEELFSA